MRGMNGLLILKEKTDKKVIYNYSCDSSLFDGFKNIIADGEIECLISDEEFKTLKTATYDTDGGQAKWLYPHLWRIIFKENCPKKRFIATG